MNIALKTQPFNYLQQPNKYHFIGSINQENKNTVHIFNLIFSHKAPFIKKKEKKGDFTPNVE